MPSQNHSANLQELQVRKKFSILIIPNSGGRTRTYTISKLTFQVLLGIFICILASAVWLIFEYATFCQKTVKIKTLKQENQELRNKYRKLQLFEQEFSDFKHRIFKIANLLGVQKFPSPTHQIDASFSPKDSFPNLMSLISPEETSTPDENISQSLAPSICPVKGFITQKFSHTHKGIDFAAKLGSPVFSTMNGVVQFVGWDDTLGNIIEISNQNGFKTVYAHLEKITAVKDINVKCGDLIGFVGSTGKSSAPHLHYEIWLNDIPQDPEKYILEGNQGIVK